VLYHYIVFRHTPKAAPAAAETSRDF